MNERAPFRLPGVQVAQRTPRPLRFPLPKSADFDRVKLAIRSETPDDLPFLCQLYRVSRAAEMRMVTHWDRETKHDFLDKQFSYQYLHHSRHYAGADFAVITLDGRPVGRMYLFWEANGGRECRLFEFQLLPEVRNRGLGSILLSALLRQAQALKRSVSLHVEPINGARRLYARFGFVPAGNEANTGALMMRWDDGPVDQGLRVAV